MQCHSLVSPLLVLHGGELYFPAAPYLASLLLLEDLDLLAEDLGSAAALSHSGLPVRVMIHRLLYGRGETIGGGWLLQSKTLQ